MEKEKLELTEEEKKGLEIHLSTPNWGDILGQEEFLDEEDGEQSKIHEEIRKKIKKNV